MAPDILFFGWDFFIESLFSRLLQKNHCNFRNKKVNLIMEVYLMFH